MAYNKDKEMKCAISAAIFFISLQLVISQCPQTCQSCPNADRCSSCKVGYYGSFCEFTCSFNCANASCDDNGSCYACDTGMYGPNCNQDCQYCKNEECGLRACTSGCKSGYYQYTDGVFSYCFSCPLNCLNGCNPDGDCNDCIDRRTGSRCDFYCNDKCLKCSQTNQRVCYACNDGFYSSNCDISCPKNCATGICDFNNGSCLNGCMSGFWGDKCEYICSDHCMQSECNEDGTCSHGCTTAYEGLYCNITTTTIIMTTTSTLCTNRVIVPSNTRSISSMTTTKATVLSSSSSESGVSTVSNCQVDRYSFGPVIGGAVAGAFFITALLVGSIAFFLHRRSVSRTSNREQRTDTMYYNIVDRSSVNEEAGQNINKASKLGTIQTPDISVYDQLSRTNTEHVYTGL